jgi:hypothetical protein
VQPLVINGGKIYGHSLFLEQLEKLTIKVEKLKQNQLVFCYSTKFPLRSLLLCVFARETTLSKNTKRVVVLV